MAMELSEIEAFITISRSLRLFIRWPL